MSLVNQVLKDLEHRHASQAQAQELGIEDLHYVPATPTPVKKSTPWLLFASLLAVVGIGTATGGYVYYQWGMPSPVADVATPAPTAQAVLPVVAKKPEQAPGQSPEQSGAQVAQEDTVVPAVVAARPVMTTATKVEHKKPEAKVQVAKVNKPATVVKKTEPVEELVASGTIKKSIVPLRTEQRAELAYQEGHNFITARRYRKAETALRSALALEPGHLKAREMLVGVYISQGRWIEASEVLRTGVAIAPQHHTFTKLYARSLMQLKRDQQAIQVLSANKPAVTQDPEYYAILAALYQRQANHDAAARTYSQILKVQPKMGIWWVGMGISLEALGEGQQASVAYQQARKSGTLNGDVARYTDNRLLALDAINYPID